MIIVEGDSDDSGSCDVVIGVGSGCESGFDLHCLVGRVFHV